MTTPAVTFTRIGRGMRSDTCYAGRDRLWTSQAESDPNVPASQPSEVVYRHPGGRTAVTEELVDSARPVRPTRMTALGTILTVVDAVAYCDSSSEHESRVITDGHRVYAYATGYQGVDHGTGWRVGTIVALTCQQPDRHDEPCGGGIEVDLASTDTPWSADSAAILDLATYGQQVDQ